MSFIFLITALSVFVSGDSMIVTDLNVEDLIRKSYYMPVFLVLYSPHCGHCQRMHPAWRECMHLFENTTHVIVAEIDAVSQRKAARAVYGSHSYPTFIDFYRGSGQGVSVTRTVDGFSRHAQSLRNAHLSDRCNVLEVDTPLYPMFLFSTPNASCDPLMRVCSDAPLNDSQCFLDVKESSSVRVTVFYSSNFNVSLNADRHSEWVTLVRDFSREPLGNWDIATGISTTRRLLVIVYSTSFQLMELRGLTRSFSRDFLMGKIADSQLSSLGSRLKISKEDTPAIIVSDLRKGSFLVWKQIVKDAALTTKLRRVAKGAFDGQMTHPMSDLIKNAGNRGTPTFLFVIVGFVIFSLGFIIGSFGRSQNPHWTDPF
jgi:thiol-disulfide isomerase/thioredoxin